MREVFKISNLFLPRNAHIFLLLAIFFLYFLVPLIIEIFFLPDPFLRKLWLLALISISGIYLGSRRVSFRKSLGLKRIDTSLMLFYKSSYQLAILVILIYFLIYLLLIVTSQSLPILSSLLGSDANLLSDERGAFLKQRSGLMSIVSYAFSILGASMVPFSVVTLFDLRSKFRFYVLGLVFFISISFLVKAMFLNFILPLLSFFCARYSLSNKNLVALIGGIILGLYLMTSLGGFNQSDIPSDTDAEDYISTSYASNSIVDFLLWRSVVVPIIVARDTLIVHEEQFGGSPVLGATSGFIAMTTGRERVDMERLVFEYQYGGWNEIGNSNTTFLVDAYINFGGLGVFVLSFLAGGIIKLLTRGTSLAMGCMAILFSYFLVISSFFGILLSNGYLILLLWRQIQKRKLRSSAKTELDFQKS